MTMGTPRPSAASMSGTGGPWHAVYEDGTMLNDPSHTSCGKDLSTMTHRLNRWDYAAHPEHNTVKCKACLKLHPPILEPYS